MPDTTIISPEGHTLPTAERPGYGVIRYRDTGVVLAEVAHWIDDGLHFFRGTELDVVGMAESEREGVNRFVDNLEDRLELIASLSSDEVTEDESQAFRQISERFFEAWRTLEARERKRKISISFGILRKQTRGNWSPLSPGPRSQTSAPASIA